MTFSAGVLNIQGTSSADTITVQETGNQLSVAGVKIKVGSSQVESFIKQINHRVKGTEQFWNDGGLEAVLQVRAAYLSQDGRAGKHHEQRPRGPAAGRNRAAARSRAGTFQAAG